jgi:hypothetical protein
VSNERVNGRRAIIQIEQAMCFDRRHQTRRCVGLSFLLFLLLLLLSCRRRASVDRRTREGAHMKRIRDGRKNRNGRGGQYREANNIALGIVGYVI